VSAAQLFREQSHVDRLFDSRTQRMMRIKHRANRFVHRDFSRIVCSIRRTRFDSAFAALRDHRPAVTRDEPADHIELVAWFESDEFELEAAIEKYKTAETLAGDIEKDLSELKNEITVLKTKFDG
jgi:hypothetical protein